MLSRKTYEGFPLEDLLENPKQPKQHPDVEQIKRSIVSNGFLTPIIIDENNFILAGHGRKLALKELGYLTCPFVLQFSGLTEDQKRRFLVEDNKAAEFSTWNLDKVFSDFSALELKDMGFDILRDAPQDARKTLEERIEFEVNRSMDYIVMFTEKEEDFTYLCEILDLKDVVNPKNKSVGRARLVDATKVIHLIKEGVKQDDSSTE